MKDCKHNIFHINCAICWWKAARNEGPHDRPLRNKNWTKKKREEIGFRMALEIAEDTLDALRDKDTISDNSLKLTQGDSI